jgi:cytochrome b561
VIHKNINYDFITRFLHWFMAAIIIYALIVGYALHLMIDEYPKAHYFFATLNISLSVVLIPVLIIRWVWKFFRITPNPIESIPKFQHQIAEIMHEIGYFLIFFVLLSGVLMMSHSFKFFFLISIPHLIQSIEITDFFFQIHRVSCFLLAFWVLAHVTAASHHHFFRKNSILSRMLSQND